MNTKYGQLPNKQIENYQNKLIDKVYSIFFLKEGNCDTTDKYIDSLIYELYGTYEIFNHNNNFLSLVSILEMIKKETNHSKYRQKILQCTNDIIPSLFKCGDEQC